MVESGGVIVVVCKLRVWKKKMGFLSIFYWECLKNLNKVFLSNFGCWFIIWFCIEIGLCGFWFYKIIVNIIN